MQCTFFTWIIPQSREIYLLLITPHLLMLMFLQTSIQRQTNRTWLIHSENLKHFLQQPNGLKKQHSRSKETGPANHESFPDVQGSSCDCLLATKSAIQKPAETEGAAADTSSSDSPSSSYYCSGGLATASYNIYPLPVFSISLQRPVSLQWLLYHILYIIMLWMYIHGYLFLVRSDH